MTRNAIHRNGGDGARVLGSGVYSVPVTLSENTIGANGAVAPNGSAINADDGGVHEYAGANTVVNWNFPFTQANGGFFGSHRNNFGAFGTSGTISTATAQ